uniref:peptidylprolyl isomerase n=1 Tax=Timema douglasi TaxID=61478 RepID=A0A7R8Z8S6_TIMDO|nr:unnamed protein product [Timema douglasi]
MKGGRGGPKRGGRLTGIDEDAAESRVDAKRWAWRSNSTTSKLASLFGFSKIAEESKASLTYTAPKQPKKIKTEICNDTNQFSNQIGTNNKSSSSPPTKLNIIVVKPVHTYKLEGSTYTPQGGLGAAVLGNAEAGIFELLLYKGKKQHITFAKITSKFQFTVGLARANCFEEDAAQSLQVQDLLAGEGPKVGLGDSLEIRFSAKTLTLSQIGEELDNNLKEERGLRVKLKTGDWEEGLLGANRGLKRLIVLPPNMLGLWKDKVGENSRVVLEVEIIRIKLGKDSRESTPNRLPSLQDSGESAIDSSTDDTSIKARGASISEALTNSPKTHKASIISRMAKMGQATLPLKGAIPCNPSDSEETEASKLDSYLRRKEEVSGPRTLPVLSSAKPPAKLRSVKSRLSAQPQPQPMTDTPTSSSNSIPQQMAMYQTMPWQQTHLPAGAQQFMRNGSVQQFSMSPQYTMDGQLFPIVPHMITPQMIQTSVSTPSAIPSPDSHLSVFLSEARTHNSEVRMGVAKVAEKVDQVLSKLDILQFHQPSQALSISSVDPPALLASVQKLVSENGQLHNELIEKRTKVDELNDKMYHLLHTNQKYLEQSNSRMEHSQDTHLQTLILTLQQEKEKLSVDLSNALARVDSLQSEVKNLQKTVNQLTEQRSALSAQLQTMQAELENTKSNSQGLEEQLRVSLQSRALVDEYVKNLQSNISQLESEQALLQKQLSSANERLEKEGKATENHLNELAKNHKDQIDELKRKLEIQTHNNKSSIDQNSIEEEIQQRLNSREQEIAEKYSIVIKQLEQDHVDLKRQINEFNNKGVAKSYVDDAAIQSSVVDEVKKGVTLQLLENGKTSSKSVKIEALDKNPVKSVLSQETSESASKNSARTHSPDASVESPKIAVDLSVSEELTQATSDHEEEFVISEKPENKVLVDEIKINVEAKETVQNKVQHSEPISASLTPVKPDDTMKQSRESSLERGWRPQPPPPPLFDDDDDDDDWLS